MLTVIGNAGFSDVDNTTLLENINDAYHDICALEPWPFLEKKVTLTFDGTSGVPTNLPTDLRSVIKVNDTVTGISLEPMRIEEHLQRHGSMLNLADLPIYYFWDPDRTLNVYPIPSSSPQINSLDLRYLQWEPDLLTTSLSADLLLPARFHRVIIDSVLSVLYLEEDDEAQSDYFQNRADRRVERMRSVLWQRNFDRPDTIEALSEDSDFYGGLMGADYGAFGP